MSSSNSILKSFEVCPGIEAKGRNGYFRLAEITVFGSDNDSCIDFYSTRQGNAAPARIIGTRHDLILMCRAILARLRGEDSDPIERIAAAMSGRKWDADTCDEIAEIVRGQGFVILEPGELASDGDSTRKTGAEPRADGDL